ncbi:MAG: DNA polymerase III subunit delta' [Actinomycetaceae bacterium]|nr:DNA polymerase III subunit delta' [Actinomycetaceae bacterium]
MSVWDDIVGQETAVDALREAAIRARDIVEGHGGDGARGMTHSWLITGPPGSGRSTAARAFAAALQCTGDEVGCGECAGCRTTLSKSNADVNDLETQKIIISIDEVRGLIHAAQTSPTQGRWRVILVEDADRMVERTSNVLLKAIEEPPERTVWLLCAPSPDDLITTIRSRCRHVGLRIPPVGDVAELLVRRWGIAPDVAAESARLAQSHIGRARGLAENPTLREQRRTIIEHPIRSTSVGEAVLAAENLVETAKEQAKADTEERNAQEKAYLLRTLGIEEGEKINPALRSQIKQLEDEQKRRATRAERDFLDRALLDLLAFYRDVMAVQLDTGAAIINVGLEDLIQSTAQRTTTSDTMRKTRAIETARERLRANVAPVLAIEAMAVTLVK